MKSLYQNFKCFCIAIIVSGGFLVSCADLNVTSPTINVEEEVFANQTTMMLYLSRLYSQMPFEDFKYSPARGFFNDWMCIPDANTGQCLSRESNWAMTEEGNRGGDGPYWWRAFASLRDANILLENIPKYKDNFSESFYNHCIGEAYFTRAMVFYALAKRYGGAPLVTKVLNYPVIPAAELEVPRASEEETWDQVLSDFNEAIKYLSETSPQRGLANKNVALGFKSEAMLFAGSLAKYNRVTGTGVKTGVRVIGFDPGKEATLSKKYFREAYNAAREIMKKNRYALYKKAWAPNDRQAQYQNMVDMFFDINSEENIMIKEYSYPNLVHGYDSYACPRQQMGGDGYSSLANPTLDFVELFDGLPKNPDGTIKVFDKDKNSYSEINASFKYVLYDHPLDFFKNAEPRLRAYVVFPDDDLLGEPIDIRRGIYTGDVTNGISPLMCVDGIINYNYSGFRNYSNVDAYTGRGAFSEKALYADQHFNNRTVMQNIPWMDGRDTTITASGRSGPFNADAGAAHTGFSIRKWLNPKMTPMQHLEGMSTQPFILMRYAEILLNMAEAACELTLAGEAAPAGDNFQELATKAISDIRERAGADPLVGPLVLNEDGKKIIRRERQKELAYENKNLWDIRRWRTQHSDYVREFTQTDGVYFSGLYPFYSTKAKKWFFDARYDEQNWRFRLTERDYYFAIPSGEVTNSPVIDQQPGR